jgi:hypothetical protein
MAPPTEGNMRRIAIIVFVAAALSGTSAASFAQTGLSQIAKNLKQVDKNFDVADANHDGKLTRAEAQSGATPMIANHFDAIDTGHKGYVTKADVHAFIQRNLTRGHMPASASSTH